MGSLVKDLPLENFPDLLQVLILIFILLCLLDRPIFLISIRQKFPCAPGGFVLRSLAAKGLALHLIGTKNTNLRSRVKAVASTVWIPLGLRSGMFMALSWTLFVLTGVFQICFSQRLIRRILLVFSPRIEKNLLRRLALCSLGWPLHRLRVGSPSLRHGPLPWGPLLLALEGIHLAKAPVVITIARAGLIDLLRRVRCFEISKGLIPALPH